MNARRCRRVVMREALAVLLLACWIIPAAGAETYRYETEEGTLAFTDDLKRVPARYRGSAEKVVERSLWTYARFTPVPRGATNRASPGAIFEEVLTAPSEAVASESSPAKIAIEVKRGLWVQLDPSSDAPVHVEREYGWVDGEFRGRTVVRQGDKVLAIRPER
jgi:hypothetical protein